jgi:eukaryotic-like serine/threonine-protein kinase
MMSAPSPSDTNRWQQLNELLDDGLTLPPEERLAWLEALPPEHAHLIPSLRAMLDRAHVETDTFLATPVRLSEYLPEPDGWIEDKAGKEVGPYRLIRQLGAGGMGTVWLAERLDATPKRRVALKLPHIAQAPGFAERMRREGNILATLEHPHIARLYDAGVTSDHRPYLALEHVEGQPIDVYCDANKLDIDHRLRLFLQVARAVAYAHARLIVHRDLKPSNIMVTREGYVRLLDFGVAKLLVNESSPSGATTKLTQLMGRAMTPDYASPEQIRSEEITVASDVYSLGVVLYELLTGRRPYKLKRDSAAALEEAITSAAVPTASSVAEKENARELRGDLDTILAKTLKKSVARRYGSVDAFAADIERYLDGDAVLARPDSGWYRVRKFVRRNSIAVATACTVAVMLSTISGIAVWQAHTARGEAARAEEVKRYMASIFANAVPRDGVGGVVTASDVLVAAANRLEKDVVSSPGAAAEVAVMIGESFNELGEANKGEAVLRAAIPRAEAAFGRRHIVTVRAKIVLAHSLKAGEIEQGLKLLDDVLPDAMAMLPTTAEETVSALRRQSFFMAKLNKKEESYESLLHAINIGEQHLDRDHAQTIQAVSLLSNTYGRFGDREKQLAAAEDSMQRAERAIGNQRPHGNLTYVERHYADALRANGRPADAVPVLKRVLTDQILVDASPTGRVNAARSQLARALLSAGRVAEAIPLLRETVEAEQSQNATESEDRVSFAMHLVDALIAARMPAEAESEFTRALGVHERIGRTSPSFEVNRLIRSARIAALQGIHDKAAQDAQQAAAIATKEQPAGRLDALLTAIRNERLRGDSKSTRALLKQMREDPLFANALPSLQAAFHAEQGLALMESAGGEAGSAEALAAFQQCTKLFERAQIELSPQTADCTIGAARLQLEGGNAKEAHARLTALVTVWEKTNPNSAWHGEALYWLSRAEAKLGRIEEASRMLARARVMLEKTPLTSLQKLRTS